MSLLIAWLEYEMVYVLACWILGCGGIGGERSWKCRETVLASAAYRIRSLCVVCPTCSYTRRSFSLSPVLYIGEHLVIDGTDVYSCSDLGYIYTY